MPPALPHGDDSRPRTPPRGPRQRHPRRFRPPYGAALLILLFACGLVAVGPAHGAFHDDHHESPCIACCLVGVEPDLEPPLRLVLLELEVVRHSPDREPVRAAPHEAPRPRAPPRPA